MSALKTTNADDLHRVREWEVVYVHLPTGDWRWQNLDRMSFRDAAFEALRREASLENCRLFDIKMRDVMRDA